MKTKTAWNTFARRGKITCSTTGEKDPWGAEIWRDADGKAYSLNYARRAGVWAFNRYCGYDKEALDD